MKQVKTMMMTAMLLMSATLFAQTKTEKIKVSGNCSSCKKHIETAAKTSGVTSADWNTKTKWLTVSYNPAKVNSQQIQKNVAAAGYDTEKVKADDKAYNALEECCQYDRKKLAAADKKQ